MRHPSSALDGAEIYLLNPLILYNLLHMATGRIPTRVRCNTPKRLSITKSVLINQINVDVFARESLI